MPQTNKFDYRLAMICGTDLPLPQFQITIHQPRIEEISLIGENIYFTGAQCLTLSKNMFVIQGKEALGDITNFQIFMMVMSDKEAKDKKDATLQTLQLLLPEYKVLITPRSLVLSSDNGNITIDENNFDDFQNILKLVFCSKNGPMDQQSFNPQGNKAQEIAQKLMRGRDRIAKEKNATNSSTITQYLSILTVGLHLSLNVLKTYTLFQLYDLIERYGLYSDWDIDIRSRLAGGKPDNHPENWMKNLH